MVNIPLLRDTLQKRHKWGPKSIAGKKHRTNYQISVDSKVTAERTKEIAVGSLDQNPKYKGNRSCRFGGVVREANGELNTLADGGTREMRQRSIFGSSPYFPSV